MTMMGGPFVKYAFRLAGWLILCLAARGLAAETIWIEAEHLGGVRGSCFPDMNGKTSGAWGLSGPGIAPEWTQGGESEWLSIACGADDDKAAATIDFAVPEAGEYRLWVRYRDWRKQTEVFAVRVEQGGKPAATLLFGEKPVVDEEDELKLLWKWAFGWDARPVELAAGPARLTLAAHVKQPGHRQVDCLCLTTDRTYEPHHREKPRHPTWQVLDDLRANPATGPAPLAVRAAGWTIPASWKVRTFRDKGFFYLWNVGKPWQEDLASTQAKRVLFPYHIDPKWVKEFREAYGGQKDVPIFSDPRVAPAFHGAGPNILDDAAFVSWLDANPDRAWGNMMNYIGPMAMTDKARVNWVKYRDRYVGNISGENLGYFGHDAKALNTRLQAARSRGEVLDALTAAYTAGNAAKQKAIFGESVAEPYRYTIPCQSVEMTAYAHACREWGARTVGYESHASAPSLAMRLAFLRGSARQYGGLSAAYRSCNFGDSATIYSEQFLYAAPRHVYDNYYDAWAGAGMTWYKFDIWHQYMAGAAIFYHEQGFDEFWIPGGGSAGSKGIQLSPKGRLVEQFLQLTRAHPDRGTPFTPIAFLLDRAHGWDPNAYRPAYFGLDEAVNPDLLRFDGHARMLKEWFKVAYHPYGPREASLNTGVNPTYIPGLFGNVFDVLVTSPTMTDALGSYPVVVLSGEVALSAEWGKKLAAYLDQGGTLVVSDEQLTGPGVAELKLPERGTAAVGQTIEWLPGKKKVASQRYRYRPVQGGQVLATAENGAALAAVLQRGKGRLVFLSVPRGLGIDGAATPLVALVLAHARQGLLPLEVEADVEWLLNRTDRGWLLTLFNSAGSNKLQHGVGPTDYAQKRLVKVRTSEKWTKATEWFTDSSFEIRPDGDARVFTVPVPAGAVRIVELQ